VTWRLPGKTSVRIDPAKLMRLIDRAIESPKARATLARVANDESRKIVVIAQQLANDELHRRPANRRTKAVAGARGRVPRLVRGHPRGHVQPLQDPRRGDQHFTRPRGSSRHGSPPHEIPLATGSPGRLVFP
jgi:hypothetical protein